MTGRIARTKRRAGVHVVLRARDEALLRGLARFRLARTEALTALYFRGVRRDTAVARLRRLHDAGFIQATMTGLAEQNVYQIGRAGREWAERHGIRADRPPALPAAHHLAITGLWARLAATLAADKVHYLKRFEPDWELRARLAGSSALRFPDAAIEIAGRASTLWSLVRVALEVDLKTERASALQRKLASYDASHCFAEDGPVELAVVLIGAEARRIASVRSLLEWHRPGRGRVILEADWPEALLRDLRSRPPAGSPYGEGRAEPTTLSGSADSLEQGEELSRSTESPGAETHGE